MQQKNTNEQLIVHHQSFFKEQTFIAYFDDYVFSQGTDNDCFQKQSRKKGRLVNDGNKHHSFIDGYNLQKLRPLQDKL